MLLGFQKRFEPYVLDGSKTHSIRAMRKRPFKIGDICDCYGDVRQKSMHLLGRFPCLRAELIRIFHGRCSLRMRIVIGEVKLTAREQDLLAWRDGFRLNGSELNPVGCFDEMEEFWEKTHGQKCHVYLPRFVDFTGQIVHWQFFGAELRKLHEDQRSYAKEYRRTKQRGPRDGMLDALMEEAIILGEHAEAAKA